jgi:hypothetical protein
LREEELGSDWGGRCHIRTVDLVQNGTIKLSKVERRVSVLESMRHADRTGGIFMFGNDAFFETKGLGCIERLIDIGDNVVRMLDANRKPHIPVTDTGLQLLFW